MADNQPSSRHRPKIGRRVICGSLHGLVSLLFSGSVLITRRSCCCASSSVDSRKYPGDVHTDSILAKLFSAEVSDTAVESAWGRVAQVSVVEDTVLNYVVIKAEESVVGLSDRSNSGDFVVYTTLIRMKTPTLIGIQAFAIGTVAAIFCWSKRGGNPRTQICRSFSRLCYFLLEGNMNLIVEA